MALAWPVLAFGISAWWPRGAQSGTTRGRCCGWDKGANAVGGPRGWAGQETSAASRKGFSSGKEGVTKPADLAGILAADTSPCTLLMRTWEAEGKKTSDNNSLKCHQLLAKFRQLLGWASWRRAWGRIGRQWIGEQQNSRQKCVLGQNSHVFPDAVRWDGQEPKFHWCSGVVPLDRRLGNVDGPSGYCFDNTAEWCRKKSQYFRSHVTKAEVRSEGNLQFHQHI